MTRPREPDEIDADLARIVESSGRSPTRGALLAFIGALLIFMIDRLSGGVPTTLGYVAAAVIVAVTAPSLLALAIADRRRSIAWAVEEQQRRALLGRRDAELRADLDGLRRELAAQRRRERSQSHSVVRDEAEDR